MVVLSRNDNSAQDSPKSKIIKSQTLNSLVKKDFLIIFIKQKRQKNIPYTNKKISNLAFTFKLKIKF